MRTEELVEPNNQMPSNEARTQAERLWLAENRDKYAGQWVALDGRCLLAHGAEAQAVYQSARAALAGSGRVPLVVLIESADALPFGGW